MARLHLATALLDPTRVAHASAGVFPRQILLHPPSPSHFPPTRSPSISLCEYLAGVRAPSSLILEMSTPAGLRKSKKASTPSFGCGGGSTAPPPSLGRGGGSTAPSPSLGRGGGSVVPPPSFGLGGGSAAPLPSFGRGGGSAMLPPSLGRGGGSATPWMDGFTWWRPHSVACMDGYPFPSSPCGGDLAGSSAWRDEENVEASSPGSWEKNIRPPGGFMSFFGNQEQNSHLVGATIHSSPPNQAHNASSSSEVEIRYDNDSTRTEKRIMWTVEEDVRVMSAWIEHSTNSSCGADRAGNQYWGDVVESYNKTTPPLRRRNLKQCKDRWHKINRWTDLFECAYVKAPRIFTSGYSDQMWIDATHKFYVDDNKHANLGPFVLMEVWKMCRDVPKWKTYNEELKNARKRKSFHLEGDSQEDDATPDEMPKRPIGQKAAKKAALAAKGKNKESGDESGNSKESAIDLDKFDKYSKFQEDNHEKRLKILEVQQKLSFEKLEASKIAHLTAQENKEAKKLEKESKMMEAYLNISSQDTSSMSDVDKAERVVVMKCLRRKLFPTIK